MTTGKNTMESAIIIDIGKKWWVGLCKEVDRLIVLEEREL